VRAGSGDRGREVRALVARQMPDYLIASVVQSGEGQDNIAYEVNGELIVRFSKEPDAARRAARVHQEADLLAAVRGIAPLPVPEPRFTVAERGCLAYFKIPGLPLLDLSQPPRLAVGASIAATLGGLLAALHSVPLDSLAGLVGTDDQPPDEWRREAAESYLAVAEEVPAMHRRRVEAFLEATAPEAGYVQVFSHNDLGVEHVLVEPDALTVTGVIDWSDAAICDPAYDFGLLCRDLGPAALELAIRGYRSDLNDLVTLAERAVFYARCSVLEDLAYGVETGGQRLVELSLAAMEWLFPASAPPAAARPVRTR